MHTSKLMIYQSITDYFRWIVGIIVRNFDGKPKCRSSVQAIAWCNCYVEVHQIILVWEINFCARDWIHFRQVYDGQSTYATIIQMNVPICTRRRAALGFSFFVFPSCLNENILPTSGFVGEAASCMALSVVSDVAFCLCCCFCCCSCLSFNMAMNNYNC